MKMTMSSRALFSILFVVAMLVGTPLAIFQLQQQQEVRQRADTTIAWTVSQSAASSCPTTGTGAVISVTFTNEEPDRSSTAMTVTAMDRQTGKSVALGSIRGGQTKSGIIQTGRPAISSGTVDFNLTWTDGHSGTDSRSATYRSITNCSPTPTATPPLPTVTIKPSTTPKPSTGPSPTICPTLPPVSNVRIDCPNCP